jgi:MFS family permease
MPDPRWAGLALGIVSVGQNMGMFFGPPVVGNLIAGGNWAVGVIPLMLAVANGVVASVVLRAKQTRSTEPVTRPAS